MTRLARSPELRASLGRGGLARVQEDYLAWDAKADRILEVLHEVVAERLAATPSKYGREDIMHN